MSYTATAVEDLLDPLAGMKISAGGVAKKIGDDATAGTIADNLLEWWRIEADQADVDEIMALVDGGSYLSDAIAATISKNHTLFGWTTHGHTEDVPLWSFGPNRPIGLFDNTDLAAVTVETMGLDLKKPIVVSSWRPRTRFSISPST